MDQECIEHTEYTLNWIRGLRLLRKWIDILCTVCQDTQNKIPWYRIQYNQQDRIMAYRQEIKGSSGWRGFKLVINCQWSTTIIYTRAYLILTYINDLKWGVTSKILQFADNTKRFRKNIGNGDKQLLQDNIDTSIMWSEQWHMLLLNLEKCKCIHAGHRNTGHDFMLVIFAMSWSWSRERVSVTCYCRSFHIRSPIYIYIFSNVVILTAV